MRIIGEFRTLDDAALVMNARREEIGLSCEALDHLAGLAAGHTGKALGPARIKGLGSVTFQNFTAALALKFLAVEDEEAAARLSGRWSRQPRKHAGRHAQRRALGERTLNRVLPEVARQMGRKGAATLNARLTPKQRSESAKRAAQARWRKSGRSRRAGDK